MITKLSTGVTTSIRKGRSLIPNNEERVQRVEVESEYFNQDSLFDDVTLDTAYENWQRNVLETTFKTL